MHRATMSWHASMAKSAEEDAQKWKEAYIDAVANIAELHAQIARMHTELAAAYANSETAPSSKKRKHTDNHQERVAPAAAAAAAAAAEPPGRQD